MFKIKHNQYQWHNHTLDITTGLIARQADSSVIVKYNRTVIMTNITINPIVKEKSDFLPLTVNYIEKYYATGKFPKGFIKRESRPSEREILISRLIDRSIRPLFPKNFYHDINITCTLLSHNTSVQTEVIAFIGVATALKISKVPFQETVGISNIAIIGNQIIPNISNTSKDHSSLNLIVTGTKKSIVMIESCAEEIDQVTMMAAIAKGHLYIVELIKIIDDFVGLHDKKTMQYDNDNNIDIINKLIKNNIEHEIEQTFQEKNKKTREKLLEIIYKEQFNKLSKVENIEEKSFNTIFKQMQKSIFRKLIIKYNTRTDGRNFDEVRDIDCQINILPETHGSALFTRGETQVLAITTLGSNQDMQLIDNVTETYHQQFTLHYNFPPYCTGESGQLKPPSRRELGHGKLVLKSLNTTLPNKSLFPYSTRVVCEVTESNGSSSMASVCASSMALMNAGVPIKSTVSGISIGLLLNNHIPTILTDISGEEDNIGDMDLKVSTTNNGITALQMDTKIVGITIDIIDKAIKQAIHSTDIIRDKMESTIKKPENMKNNAPKIHVININKNQIKNLIGPSGKVIKKICDESKTKIDIDEHGKITIFSSSKKELDSAINMIRNVIEDPIIGCEYEAIITNIKKFGIFVRFCKYKEGLVHISEISDIKIKNLEEVFNKDQKVIIKILGYNDRKFKITMKNVKQNNISLEKNTQS